MSIVRWREVNVCGVILRQSEENPTFVTIRTDGDYNHTLWATDIAELREALLETMARIDSPGTAAL